MSWLLSRFRVGDVVEVCTKEEILATLDRQGCLDGMPFMPEMFKHCGRRFQISAIAHKTCDTARQTWKGRRLNSTVHLTGLRCDGSAHGGCQAECNLFWKDEWLKPVGRASVDSARSVVASNVRTPACSESELFATTYLPSGSEGQISRYFCQATEMYGATRLLHWWDVRQYVFDVLTGNHSFGRVVCVVFLASLRWMLPHIPCGYQGFKKIHDWAHFRFTGRKPPFLNAQIPDGALTPAGKLNLVPGEIVRIKTQEEIEQTVNKLGKNRGLAFDHEEMAPYCGGTFTVRKSVTKIIDEPTGKMLTMKQPCIMLEGVVCRGEYAHDRLNCPRAIPSYWREIWLEKLADNKSAHETKNLLATSTDSR